MTAAHRQQWGGPPLALIPSLLANRLAKVRLPDWLSELLGEPGATASALTAAAWEHLPDDESVRDQVRRYVLELVTAHARELDDAPVGSPASLTRTRESLGLTKWPTRSRNAILRIGLDRDPGRLASLTFGGILDVPHVGVRTALQTAALLEVFLSSSDLPQAAATETSVGRSVKAVPSTVGTIRWGEPGSPLLPKTLRRAFADEILPSWLLHDLHLPRDATALALDSSAWRHLDRLPARAERFLLGLVTYRIEGISDLRIIEGSWPSDVSPENVPWPTRVYNALGRSRLLASDCLERLTYGELLAIPAIGMKSVLEFAVIADTVTAVARVRVLGEVTRLELAAAAEEEWAERVRADDPRFRDVVPPYLGSLSELFEEALNNPEGPRAHALAESLPQIRARAEDIASEPIDLALVRFLKSLGASDRNVAMVVARFGWRDGGPRTLQEVGEEFSLTRERVRQVVAKTISRVRHAYLPQIECAIQVVTDHAPIPARDAARLLMAEHLSTVPIEPQSLQSAARLVGYDLTFYIDPGDGTPVVLAQGLAGTGAVFNAARREAGRVGVSNIEEVQAVLEANGQDYSTVAVSRIIRSSPKIKFLNDEWFWMPDIPPGRNRLRNVTQRMLSVTPRLDIGAIRQGVRRRYRFMRIDLVPPISVLKAFYGAHSEFMVNDDGTVESSEPLDYRHLLGDVEQVFVEVLRAAPTGLMDRAELEEGVTGRGVNPNTFSVFTTYSPILDHPANSVWCLRGQAIDPAQLEALRAVIATRSRHRRTLAYGWDEEGGLWVTAELANIGSPVIGIPATISRYVVGRRFHARTQEGTPAGVIAIDESGASWGYGPFLRRRGAESGDALTIRFDLATEGATLTLDGNDSLVDENV